MKIKLFTLLVLVVLWTCVALLLHRLPAQNTAAQPQALTTTLATETLEYSTHTFYTDDAAFLPLPNKFVRFSAVPLGLDIHPATGRICPANSRISVYRIKAVTDGPAPVVRRLTIRVMDKSRRPADKPLVTKL